MSTDERFQVETFKQAANRMSEQHTQTAQRSVFGSDRFKRESVLHSETQHGFENKERNPTHLVGHLYLHSCHRANRAVGKCLRSELLRACRNHLNSLGFGAARMDFRIHFTDDCKRRESLALIILASKSERISSPGCCVCAA